MSRGWHDGRLRRTMVDTRDNVAKHMAVAWRQTIAYIARKMEPLHLGSGQYPYLFALYDQDGQSQQRLSQRLMVNKSATVGAVDKLERLGYVERRPDRADRRRYRVYLTEKGRRVRAQLEAIVGEALEALQTGLTVQERETFRELMRRAADNMVAATRRPPPPESPRPARAPDRRSAAPRTGGSGASHTDA